MVRDDAGSPQGVAAIMRDVTARRQQEQEIKQRLASLEAK
jgi:signal transduction histidine kinase